jgi:general secretion pathway protein M
MTLLPASIADAWYRASPRERVLLRWGAVVVLLALLYAVAWQPLARDIARVRETLARDRATLDVLRSYAQPQRSAGTTSAPPDVRAAVERALDAHGLRVTAGAPDARDNRVSLVLGAVPFDTLVALLDELSRTDHVRVIEARLTARVDPGTVRAELTLGR